MFKAWGLGLKTMGFDLDRAQGSANSLHQTLEISRFATSFLGLRMESPEYCWRQEPRPPSNHTANKFIEYKSFTLNVRAIGCNGSEAKQPGSVKCPEYCPRR